MRCPVKVVTFKSKVGMFDRPPGNFRRFERFVWSSLVDLLNTTGNEEEKANPRRSTFFGLTHISGKNRKGIFTVRRTAIRRRMGTKLQENLLYLLPYSPNLNPIEKAWAKLKQQLRSVKARTTQDLEQAIAELLPTIRPQNATAWFRIPFQALHQ